jgi:hypothetical protein
MSNLANRTDATVAKKYFEFLDKIIQLSCFYLKVLLGKVKLMIDQDQPEMSIHSLDGMVPGDVERFVGYYIAKIEPTKAHQECLHKFNAMIEATAKNVQQRGELNLGISEMLMRDGQQMQTAFDEYASYLDENDAETNPGTRSRGDLLAKNPVLFKKFLEGLLKYFDMPINNRKIANYVGNSMRSVDIKRIKRNYLKFLRKKARVKNVPVKETLMAEIQMQDPTEFLKYARNTKH